MSSAVTSHGVTLDAVAWGRAENGKFVTAPIVCADGFSVSVQASWGHYSHDSDAHRVNHDEVPAYPWRSFELGYPSERPEPWHCSAWHEGWDRHEDHAVCDGWEGYSQDDGSIFAYVPHAMVRALLDSHGGEA